MLITLPGMIIEYTLAMSRLGLLDAVGWKHPDSFHALSYLIKVLDCKISNMSIFGTPPNDIPEILEGVLNLIQRLSFNMLEEDPIIIYILKRMKR
jgi:hypothetical protein